MDECIFCQIASGKMKAEKVWESKEILAFEDIHPQAPVHVLLIPKKHVDSLAKAEPRQVKLLGELMLAAADAAKQLGIGESFQLKVYNGKEAGQTVFHLHLHLMGGWKRARKH